MMLLTVGGALPEVARRTFEGAKVIVLGVVTLGMTIAVCFPVIVGLGAAYLWGVQFVPADSILQPIYYVGGFVVIFEAYRYLTRGAELLGALLLGDVGPLRRAR